MNPARGATTEFEIASMRQTLNLIATQLKVGRVDAEFIARQVDKMNGLLERLNQERQETRNVQRYEALYDVSKSLGSSLDLQVVLDQVMDAIIKLTGAERAFLMLQDDDGGLRIRAARNFDQQTLDSDNSRYSRTIANQVLDSGQPILTTNATEDPRFNQQASIVGQALRSIMATPLRARGVVIGVAYVDSRALAGLFRSEDLDALDALCSQAAIAIDNARLFNATDQELSLRVEELRQLRRIDLLLNETLDLEKAMGYTLEWAVRLAGANSGHLGLVDGDQFHTMQHYGDSSAVPQSQSETQTSSAISSTSSNGVSLALDSLYPEVWEAVKSGKVIQLQNRPNEVHFGLIVPIRREPTTTGIVILEKTTAQPFSVEELDLVDRVVARAAIAIENARLYAAVRAADKAKSEFVGIVAHDLKAPMNGIGGYAELMLMQGQLSDRQQDYLRKIKDTVRRMEVLVSDLADISRIESGHFFMEISPTPVSDIVQAVKDNCMPQIAERKHTWVERIEPGLPLMQVDYYRLLQVLTNLVSNAYKYTPDGGTITLEASRQTNRVRFTVIDTGIGLSDENIKMLGTKFWRAEDRYTRSQPGTGLGFAITRSLVEQMGSQMEIKSEAGKGSTFSFDVAVAD
ncbi:MAG TPA: GAF domain-containing protein [Phototrophicaceae bacterium]|nr:GAF domain-containing protein [Phototrophicaceae bacterium]